MAQIAYIYKNGHRNRIWDEITAFVRVNYAGPSEDIETFVKEQTTLVLKKMYENDRPEDEDPEVTHGCYYRPFIARYGSVYDDSSNPRD